MSIRLFSWNVNGFRAVLGKGFGDWLAGAAPDVLGLQEVKAEEGQIGEARHFPGYACVWNAARTKKGYSGTACYTRHEPLAVHRGLPDERYRGEGRVIRYRFKFNFLERLSNLSKGVGTFKKFTFSFPNVMFASYFVYGFIKFFLHLL